jgi:hypothetical protein
MSDVQQELLAAIIGSGKWFSPKQLCEITGRPSGTVSPLLAEMVEAGVVQRMKPPPGFVKGGQVILAESGLAAPEGATPMPAVKPPKAANPKKLKGFRAAARARKPAKHTKRKKHAKRGERVAITAKGNALLAAQPYRVKALVPRWALTSDGAFVDLTDSTEISKAKARALVDFVRILDAGDA